jgi:AraC-like DNA-binding protein
MMNYPTVHKKRDGFEGEKLISLPDAIWQHFARTYPTLSQVYITHIGYFPKANFHYRERKKGCRDNILIYCLQGKGWYETGNTRFEVSANQFVLIPANDLPLRYGADDKDPWTIYWVHFSGTNMTAFNHSFSIGLSDGPRSIPLNQKGLQIWISMYESLEMGYSKDNLFNANFCLYHFIATFLYPDKHLAEKSQSAGNIIDQTISFMRNRLAKKLTVDEIAAQHNLSASYFSTLFRTATGMPPIDYFIHLRIQKACQLLYQGELKVKEVAETIGYDDPYHFSRLFKKHMNASPEQYKALRKNMNSLP